MLLVPGLEPSLHTSCKAGTVPLIAQMRNLSSERLRDLPKVTQPHSSNTGFELSAPGFLWPPSPLKTRREASAEGILGSLVQSNQVEGGDASKAALGQLWAGRGSYRLQRAKRQRDVFPARPPTPAPPSGSRKEDPANVKSFCPPALPAHTPPCPPAIRGPPLPRLPAWSLFLFSQALGRGVPATPGSSVPSPCLPATGLGIRQRRPPG